MNDPFDNSKDDKAMLGKYPADPSGARYPDPHYDEDDNCPCPDHVAMRARGPEPAPLLQRFLAASLGRDPQPEPPADAEGAWQCGAGHMFRYEPPPAEPPWCPVGPTRCMAGNFRWIIKDMVTESDWLSPIGVTPQEAEAFHAALTEDDMEHQATIRASMSDLAVANEVIRVVGYDRLPAFLEQLSDRYNDITEQNWSEAMGHDEQDPSDDYQDDANPPPAERYGYQD